MKLQKPSKKFKTQQRAPKHLKKEVAAIVEYLKEKAKPGTPYTLFQIADELVAARLLRIDRDSMPQLSYALSDMIQLNDWFEFGAWGHFGLKGKTTLRQLIDGASVRGATYDVPGYAKLIEMLTGEEVEHGVIRKTLQRLVSNGKFIRVDRGMYQRVAKGF